ncbi:MAG: CatA-like O-acetyltransferase [Bacilli bacterium]|jgi:chloramphenicol O-acetyltransferase|nr:CatA-like O-acetyltransferase [Bacilli bacterium]
METGNNLSSGEEIDLSTYPKRSQYFYFSKFEDPSYGFDVDIDVTNLVLLLKKRKESFFSGFFFLVMLGINSVKETRMRSLKGHVYLYDVIHPTYTVMGKDSVYRNASFPMSFSYKEFYKRERATTKEASLLPASDDLDRYPINALPNVVFASCLPTLSILGIKHPIPSGDKDSISVPRILWDRIRTDQAGKMHVTLNITLSHALVDGFPLASVFQKIQSLALHPEEVLK